MLAAGALGILGLIGGMVVPALLDPSTVQGPLLGIFVTGPLGVIIGGHAGIVWSAQQQNRTTWSALAWLAAFGGLILLLNEAFNLVGIASIVPPSAFLVTAATTGALLVYPSASRPLTRLLVALAVATPLLFVTGLFPPVTMNDVAGARAMTPPHFVFVLDSGLDTRRRVPPWRIDRSTLHLEWAAVIMLSGLVAAILGSRDRTGPKRSDRSKPGDGIYRDG